MDKLDKFIIENAGSFNDSEPDPGHFKRFRAKLDQGSGKGTFRIHSNLMLKIAAVILILITATFLIFYFVTKPLNNAIEMNSAGTGMTDEIRDAMVYYDGQTKNRLIEFNKLACCGEEKVHLNSMVSGELNTLDANIAELKQTLQANPDNERIQAALIQNQQMKEQVLDNMINQMKKQKDRINIKHL
jgi:hypothetical protein